LTVGGYENCYDGNEWTSVCSSNTDCAENCALEGATYGTTYGATTSGDALTLKFVTEHQYGTNIGSRFYLMENDQAYQMFTLAGNEFAFDVDLSTVECGINSALYFVAMEPDGGMSSYPTNAAGAKYGTGYCDAQCARDLKFIGGVVSVPWESSFALSCSCADRYVVVIGQLRGMGAFLQRCQRRKGWLGILLC
jgi:cellulose 1,4-beta-cellobiosidase